MLPTVRPTLHGNTPLQAKQPDTRVGGKFEIRRVQNDKYSEIIRKSMSDERRFWIKVVKLIQQFAQALYEWKVKE